MALETVVFQQDPFINYASKDAYDFDEDNFGNVTNFTSQYLHFPSTDVCTDEVCPVQSLTNTNGSKKRRRRNKSTKNKEETESQRMTHITVERNRRKQMNEYLSIIRSLMPPSYSLRGDQASIVGGAITFVKELEQRLQYLEAQKQKLLLQNYSPNVFTKFFTFPQYSTYSNRHGNTVSSHETMGEKPSSVADVEVAMVEAHANIKILSTKQPKQLLRIVAGFYSLGLNILHLNVTTADQMTLYSFSIKVQEESQLGTVAEMANIIHEMMGKIQEVPMSS